MKKILITGVNSYVGNSFEKWLKQYSTDYEVDKVSLRDNTWKQVDLSYYDSILHVAGIAHVSTSPEMEDFYYKINRDLTCEIAHAAKEAGVKHFTFMSSIIVYGDSKAGKVVIDRYTQPNPSNFYGQSKLEAEKLILPLESKRFKIAIVRPPMIYGKNSKGNYPKLAKVAKTLPIFPSIYNERSMLHIDNLSEFLRLIIKNNDRGFFFPQNKEYVKTSNLVKIISEVHNKKIHLTKVFNPILNLMISRVNIVNKVFGNLVYDQDISAYDEPYHNKDLYESIIATELEKK